MIKIPWMTWSLATPLFILKPLQWSGQCNKRVALVEWTKHWACAASNCEDVRFIKPQVQMFFSVALISHVKTWPMSLKLLGCRNVFDITVGSISASSTSYQLPESKMFQEWGSWDLGTGRSHRVLCCLGTLSCPDFVRPKREACFLLHCLVWRGALVLCFHRAWLLMFFSRPLDVPCKSWRSVEMLRWGYLEYWDRTRNH